MHATSDGEAQYLLAYQPVRSADLLPLEIRGLRYTVRRWQADGDARQILLMLHGWMDVSASFQFLVDHLPPDWLLFAPDWRGFGLSDRGGSDTYWFADYLADLEAIIDGLVAAGQIAPPINLLGHSMGGNVACLYAGVRPHRIARLVNLEGVGLPDSDPAQAPARYARWLDGLAKGMPGLRSYASPEEVAGRLMRNNPRLTPARAAFLAEHWAVCGADGRWHLRADPWHKASHPIPYRVDEVNAFWRAISAPVLWLRGSESEVGQHLVDSDRYRARLREVRELHSGVVQGAGHMLHHDRPQEVAQLIRDFVGA